MAVTGEEPASIVITQSGRKISYRFESVPCNSQRIQMITGIILINPHSILLV